MAHVGQEGALRLVGGFGGHFGVNQVFGALLHQFFKMIAVLPQFISPTSPLLPQLLILAVTMCTIDQIVMHSYAFLASSMQRFFRDARAVKKQNRFFGGLLMAVGTALFFVKRGGQAAS